MGNDPVNLVDPTGLCTFKINLNIVGGGIYGSAAVIAVAQNEIRRIFSSTGHFVTFDANATADRTLNYSILTAGISSNTPNAGGSTVLGSNGGEIYGLRLLSLASTNFFLGRGIGGYTTQGMGLALGRVIAHEAVTHALLNLTNAQHTPA